MLLYLDSASTEDAEAAAGLDVISGITTNPTLMARAGTPPEVQLGRLLEILPQGRVFFQVEDRDHDAALEQALRVWRLAPDRVAAKLPATLEQFRLAATLRRHEIPVAMTAVYTPAQAVLAAQVGAKYVITYVDRARRLRPEAPSVVAQVASALRPLPERPLVMAASLKSPEQTIDAIADGADCVTLPLDLIKQLAHDELTEQAIAEFDEAAGAG